jgi:hypothetical protein
MHGRRAPKCCWRCDKCPTCQPEIGRLLKGDYCKACTEKMKAEGLVWSTYYMNWVKPEDRAAVENSAQLSFMPEAN